MEDPTGAHVIEKLLNIGGTAGVLYVAIWFLVRTLKEQYENRITALESRSDKCEQDRAQIHREVRSVQAEQISILRDLIRQDAKIEAQVEDEQHAHG